MKIRIDDIILINQLAQGIVAIGEGERWFSDFDVKSRKAVLYNLGAMISQAHPKSEDAISAIVVSGLRKTLTPCILLSKPNLNAQLARMIDLPEPELPNVFKLLIHLLGIADKRRRETKPIDTVNHWWHRDLRNPEVIAEIRSQLNSTRQP
jgi:hypothetical protein